MDQKEDGKEFVYMLVKSVTAAIFILATVLAGESEASSCLTGNCHKPLTETKYLHGPVAAELAGAKGCIACHVPAGKSCSQNKKGSFKPLEPAIKMCRLCHAQGTGTQHSSKKVDCLKCHDPHGSNKNAELKR
jgi:hypothetical protein